MAKLLEFLTRKKKELEIVIEDIALDDETSAFFGEGTEEEYNNQVIADKGLKGVFGIGGGNNAP